MLYVKVYLNELMLLSFLHNSKKKIKLDSREIISSKQL